MEENTIQQPQPQQPYQQAPVPPKFGWSWGAFMYGWIWGIANHAYLTLLSLVPLLNIVWCFVNAICGKKWAWQSGKFATPAEFNAVQKSWDRAGIVMFIVTIISCIITAFTFSAIVAMIVAAASGSAGGSAPDLESILSSLEASL